MGETPRKRIDYAGSVHDEAEIAAQALDKLLAKINQPLDLVLFFEVDYEEIVKRLLGRGRADDNEETIRNRLRVFEEKTAPLIDYYTNKGLLRTIKGTGSIDEIGARIRAALDEIARHAADERRVRADQPPGLGEMARVTQMKGVIFRHNAADPHKNLPKGLYCRKN